MKSNKEHLQAIEYHLKKQNLRIIGVQEWMEQEQEIESLFKEITVNFPKLQKETFGYRNVREHQTDLTQITLPKGI